MRLREKRHTPVLEYEAGDTSRTACLSCSESGVIVTELEERLELADIESEVNHFVAGDRPGPGPQTYVQSGQDSIP